MPHQVKSDRNIAILKARANGQRYIDLAISYGVSVPRVAQIVHATIVHLYERDPLQLLTIFNDYSKLKYVFNPTRTYKIKYPEMYDICWKPSFDCADYAWEHDLSFGNCYYLMTKYKSMRYMGAVERYYSENAKIADNIVRCLDQERRKKRC